MSACYISMTRSVSGRAAAVEQWERGETGGSGVDSGGWGGGQVDRRAKAGLKGTRGRGGFLFLTRAKTTTFRITGCA